MDKVAVIHNATDGMLEVTKVVSGTYFPNLQARQEHSTSEICGLTIIQGKRGNVKNAYISISIRDWSFPIW